MRPSALKQAITVHDTYVTRSTESHRQIEGLLTALQPQEVYSRGKNRRPSRTKNAPNSDVLADLFGTYGVDPTRINGIDTAPVLKVMTEPLRTITARRHSLDCAYDFLYSFLRSLALARRLLSPTSGGR